MAPMTRIRIAALAYAALGLGFGIGGPVTMVYHAREGELPMTPFGFRSMAGAPSSSSIHGYSRPSAGRSWVFAR